ncbi:hypothetical protein EVAR_71638_1 [Eumeta japonica]|uniref:Uncharacterized protein n=1 Tax=Eumeta variegata TaxID=151549 RepID=A0A4C1SRS0_EUMVA|nr:hypothetical protein EVAR_71638_1 [Eumeta japonica]
MVVRPKAYKSKRSKSSDKSNAEDEDEVNSSAAREMVMMTTKLMTTISMMIANRDKEHTEKGKKKDSGESSSSKKQKSSSAKKSSSSSKKKDEKDKDEKEKKSKKSSRTDDEDDTKERKSRNSRRDERNLRRSGNSRFIKLTCIHCHMKCVTFKNKARKQDSDSENSGDEEMREIDLNKFMTVDSVGEIDEDIDADMEALLNRTKQMKTAKNEKERTPGSVVRGKDKENEAEEEHRNIEQMVPERRKENAEPRTGQFPNRKTNYEEDVEQIWVTTRK